MRIIHTVADLRASLRGETETAFVPTMGNLHAGHIALVEQAKQLGRPLITSIFVNPLQFGAGEDFDSYPRTLEADCEQLAAAGTDIVFAPKASEVYSERQTFLVNPPLADELCGAHRPGHFQGVATVVLKLFNMVQPRYAVFGKKDYQQLFILKGLVRQFNLPIEILGGETVRAEDGLALSSRNGYLSTDERKEAPRLYASLQAAAVQLAAGRLDYSQIETELAHELGRHGWTVDYAAIRSQATLLAPQVGETRLVVLAAAKLGSTRLIDNLEVGLNPA